MLMIHCSFYFLSLVVVVVLVVRCVYLHYTYLPFSFSLVDDFARIDVLKLDCC